MPWSIHRNDYDGLIDLANEGEGFVNFLNDERIDDYSVLFSNDLPEKAAEELFNEITIEEEREYLRKNDYRFIVFEADYFKYPTQYYNYQAGGNTNLERCFVFSIMKRLLLGRLLPTSIFLQVFKYLGIQNGFYRMICHQSVIKQLDAL